MDTPSTPPNSPSNSYAVRVSLPFQDCSGILHRWIARCHKALVYEHEEDEDVARTHVHLALVGLDCKVEALKRMWTDAPGKGNEFWSFSPLREPGKYFAYMTKGKLRPVSAKNFSPADVEEHLRSWVDPAKDDNGKDDPLKYYIDLVLARFKHIKTRQDLPDFRSSFLNQLGECSLLDEVRSVTMKVFWGVNRRMPHTSQYKIVAGSAFLHIMERVDAMDMGIAHLKNLWY